MKPKILVLERSTDLAETIREAVEGIDPHAPRSWPATGSAPSVTCCTSRAPSRSSSPARRWPAVPGCAAWRPSTRTAPPPRSSWPSPTGPTPASGRSSRPAPTTSSALPFDHDDLVIALERALDIGGRRLAGATPKAARPGVIPLPGAASAVPTQAQVFTVSSATGGCGKTFLATNMALFLARHTGKRVVLVDLDLQFGEVSTALRLRPNYTIYDALQREGRRLRLRRAPRRVPGRRTRAASPSWPPRRTRPRPTASARPT